MKSNCDYCLRLKEANKLKIPVITIPTDLNKGEIRWCRKCYLDLLAKFVELKKAYDYKEYFNTCRLMKQYAMEYKEWEKQKEREEEEKKLFDDCNYKGTFANCQPQFCVECQRRGDVAKPLNKIGDQNDS